MRGISSQKGLTLIELILVFAMISILAIITFTINVDTFTLQTQAKDLCWEIRHLRSMTMSEDIEYELLFGFEEESEKYCYIMNDVDGGSELKKVVLEKDFSLYFYSQGGFKKISSTDNVTIKFKIDGKPYDGRIIRLKNEKNGEKIDMDVDPISGRVLMIEEN